MIRLQSVKPFRTFACPKFPSQTRHSSKLKSKSQTPPPNQKSKTKKANSNASTTVNANAPSLSTSTSTAAHRLLTGRSLNEAWTIEPQVGYWNAKLRTRVRGEVMLLVVFCALTSLIAMPLAFPDPSSPPSALRENGDEAQAEDKIKDKETPAPAKKSFLSILLTPITFLLRPVLADEDARQEAEKTWQYWLGQGAGLSAIVVFALGHFVGRARHVRMLAISPSSLAASVNAGRSGGWRGGGAEAGRAGGTLRVVPALGGAMAFPVSSTVLVSPLLVGTGKGMSTVMVQGKDRSGARWGPRWGWGVHMFRDGAVVNGQWVAREEVIGLMERIWVHRGGEIRVRDGR